MIEAIIVDDEPKNIRILQKMLAEFCPEVSVLSEARDMKQAITVIKQFEPALVFLDIEMPYGNAFDLLDKLMPVNFEVIFTTAFNEYALKAIKYSALDYLLKPININELKAAVRKASELIDSKSINVRLKALLQNVNGNEAIRRIALPSKEGLVFVDIEDIIRCEASASYTNLFIKSQGKIISSKSISEYEEMLPAKIFFRIHHSHIVNLHEIKKYHRGRGGIVEMNDGTNIEVAVRRKDEFLSRFAIS